MDDEDFLDSSRYFFRISFFGSLLRGSGEMRRMNITERKKEKEKRKKREIGCVSLFHLRVWEIVSFVFGVSAKPAGYLLQQ